MKLETSVVLKRLLKRWPLLALVIVAMVAAGACASEEFTKETDLILEEVEQTGTLAGPTELEGEVLVYAEDAPALVEEIRSADTLPDKKDAVKEYLKRQQRIDCILEKIEDAVAEGTHLNCEGKELVKKDEASGLLEDINSRGSEPAQREFLGGYIAQWKDEQHFDRVMEGLAQMKRTKAIPLFGALVTRIHRFPIMFEGEVLVPKEDLSNLLKQYSALRTQEARQEMVEGYLNK